MRHVLKLVAAIALMFGVSATVVATDIEPASAHTQAFDICKWFDVVTFGPESNGVYVIKFRDVHWWGQHQAQCCYSNLNGNQAEFLYDYRGFGYWIHTAWCDPA